MRRENDGAHPPPCNGGGGPREAWWGARDVRPTNASTICIASSLPPLPPEITQGAPQAVQTVAAMMDAEINRQALMIAYIDDFRLMMILSLLAIPLLLLLRKARPAADAGHAVMD